MKKVGLISLIATALLAVPADVEVYFSPGDDCEKVIIQALEEAEARGYTPCSVCRP